MGLAFISSGFSVVDQVEEDLVTSEVRIPPGRVVVVVDIVVLRGRGDDDRVIVEELLVVHDVEGVS